MKLMTSQSLPPSSASSVMIESPHWFGWPGPQESFSDFSTAFWHKTLIKWAKSLPPTPWFSHKTKKSSPLVFFRLHCENLAGTFQQSHTYRISFKLGFNVSWQAITFDIYLYLQWRFTTFWTCTTVLKFALIISVVTGNTLNNLRKTWVKQSLIRPKWHHCPRISTLWLATDDISDKFS